MTGIRVRPTRGTKKAPYTILASKSVVSNASTWDTAKLLPKTSSPAQDFRHRANMTKKTDSFMHLHLGIDATGLPSNLECHHFVLNEWGVGIEAPQNVCIVSIPTVFDPSLAPAGCHVVHAYTAGNEPYSLWTGMDRKSSEYAALKEERSQVRNQYLSYQFHKTCSVFCQYLCLSVGFLCCHVYIVHAGHYILCIT